MYSEEEVEILRVLLAKLRDAFSIKKGKHALQAAQRAYMTAAQNYRDIERYRQQRITILGSQENTNAET